MSNNYITTNSSHNGTQNKLDKLHDVHMNKETDSYSRTMTIYIAAAISLAVLVTCVFLCFREMNRRRIESEFIEELKRRTLIKKHAQSKIEQMEQADESRSYMENMDSKIPFVTFGDVTKISPVPSFESLHHRTGSHHHLPHHHNYHLLSYEDFPIEINERVAETQNGSGGSSSSTNQNRLFHGDHHHRHHGAKVSKSSILNIMKRYVFERKTSTSSRESESGGEDNDEGIWIEAMVATE